MEDAINALQTSHAKQREELSALGISVKTMVQVKSKTILDPGWVLTKQTPEDVVEAYLEVFERTTTGLKKIGVPCWHFFLMGEEGKDCPVCERYWPLVN